MRDVDASVLLLFLPRRLSPCHAELRQSGLESDRSTGRKSPCSLRNPLVVTMKHKTAIMVTALAWTFAVPAHAQQAPPPAPTPPPAKAEPGTPAPAQTPTKPGPAPTSSSAALSAPGT